MSGGAAVIRKQNRYIEIFNKLGAIDPEHSITLDEIRIGRAYIFNRMVDRGVFIECEPGRFYLDNQAAIRFKEIRRERVLIILSILLTFFAIYYILGGK